MKEKIERLIVAGCIGAIAACAISFALNYDILFRP